MTEHNEPSGGDAHPAFRTPKADRTTAPDPDKIPISQLVTKAELRRRLNNGPQNADDLDAPDIPQGLSSSGAGLDPIADMLARIRNANLALRDEVSMPSSNLKEALAKVLLSEGYIKEFSATENESGVGRTLTIAMKYSPERERVISGIKRVSKPSLRVYTSSDQIPRVLAGLGVAVLSTDKGLVTDREARKGKVGGEVEVLCYVW